MKTFRFLGILIVFALAQALAANPASASHLQISNHKKSARANAEKASVKNAKSLEEKENGGSCGAFYKDLFAHDTLKIRMVFGYKDARPARFVGDRHERLAFINVLTAPCTSGQACGFVRSPENADLFAKDIQVENGRKVRVMIWVVNSSVGSDDEENRNDPLQAWHTRYAQAAFDSGLHDADILFYDGHSRFGGGPDFAPPHLNSHGEVDPAYYTNVRPGLQHLDEALRGGKNKSTSQSKSKLKLLGLYSCSSTQHFSVDIRKYSKVKLLSSTNLVYFSDALDESLKKISQVMERKCL